MSKINRYDGNYKAFASEQLTNERTTFGTIDFSDELTDQLTPEYLRGMGIYGPSDFPARNDFNAAHYAATQSIAYLHQMGIPEWNASQEYPTEGATCIHNGSLWFRKSTWTIGDEPGVSSSWAPSNSTIQSVFDPEFSNLIEGQSVDIVGYHPDTTVGGGRGVVKTARHNGGSAISLTRSRPASWSNQTQLAEWFADSGSDELCFVRTNVGSVVSADDYGAKNNVTYNQTIPVQSALNNHTVVEMNSGTYYFNELTIVAGKSLIGYSDKTIVSPATGSTIAINAQQPSYIDSRLLIKNIVLKAGSETAATGLKSGNITGLSIENVTIQSFSAGNGLLLQNSNSGWTENSYIKNLKMSGNLNNVVLEKNGTGTESFGYTFMSNVFINLTAGQAGIKLLGGSRLYNSSLLGVTFAYTGGGTGIDMSGGTINEEMILDVREEGSGGVLIAGGGAFSFSNFGQGYANDTSIYFRRANGSSTEIVNVDATDNTTFASVRGDDYLQFNGAGSNLLATVDSLTWNNRGGVILARSILGPTPINDASTQNTTLQLARDSQSNRSINAAGTINASGADYAEYEHNNGLVIEKGAIVGFRADGRLTDVYDESLRFAVKSTAPSIVGGDSLTVQYERELLDRIAYAGKVPVNVYGGVSGQYLIATKSDDGGIAGEFVEDPTFEQYKKCIGRVNTILSDGRAEIAVIIH